jgi:hypothetical protein
MPRRRWFSGQESRLSWSPTWIADDAVVEARQDRQPLRGRAHADGQGGGGAHCGGVAVDVDPDGWSEYAVGVGDRPDEEVAQLVAGGHGGGRRHLAGRGVELDAAVAGGVVLRPEGDARGARGKVGGVVGVDPVLADAAERVGGRTQLPCGRGRGGRRRCVGPAGGVGVRAGSCPVAQIRPRWASRPIGRLLTVMGRPTVVKIRRAAARDGAIEDCPLAYRLSAREEPWPPASLVPRTD